MPSLLCAVSPRLCRLFSVQTKNESKTCGSVKLGVFEMFKSPKTDQSSIFGVFRFVKSVLVFNFTVHIKNGCLDGVDLGLSFFVFNFTVFLKNVGWGRECR
jgi:hypothetical protein